MIDEIIAIAIIVLTVGGAAAYIIKAKKKGKKCIGCPESGSCSLKSGKSLCRSECSCGCGCSDSTQNKE